MQLEGLSLRLDSAFGLDAADQHHVWTVPATAEPAFTHKGQIDLNVNKRGQQKMFFQTSSKGSQSN